MIHDSIETLLTFPLYEPFIPKVRAFGRGVFFAHMILKISKEDLEIGENLGDSFSFTNFSVKTPPGDFRNDQA